jgi:hypothetical protein
LKKLLVKVPLAEGGIIIDHRLCGAEAAEDVDCRGAEPTPKGNCGPNGALS